MESERNEAMHAKLTALIDTAYKFVPEIIILDDDHPDTFAKAFEKASMVQHRYNSTDGWSIYSAKKYQRVEDEKELEGYVRNFVLKCEVKTTQKTKDTEGKVKYEVKNLPPSNKMKSVAFVQNVLKWLRDLPAVKLKPSQNAPCALNGCGLTPEHTIAFDNGLLDVSKPNSPALQTLTPDFYTFNYMPYSYVKDAVSMKWGEFLYDIADGDEEIITLLQTWAGYLLIPGNKYQKFLLCKGEGANGKFVFFDTLAAAIGKKNVANVPLASFNDPFKFFATHGKMVNMSNENPRNLTGDAESVIKENVGGDKMLWSQKYKDSFTAYPTAKLMFATNELPVIRDPSDGLWRRMLLVPFDVQIPDQKQNKNLANELQEPKELAGIMNWMLEGKADLEENGGFAIPKRVKEELAIYRKESNSALLFITEHLEMSTLDDDCIIKSDLYKHYQNFCKEQGNKPKNNVHFGQALKKHFTMPKDVRKTIGGQRKTAYTNLKYQDGIIPWQGNDETPQQGQSDNYYPDGY